MPKREHIPDDARHTITIDGKELAVYCRHCGKFFKGASMHSTAEHKGKQSYPYVGPAPSGAPAPAPAPAPDPAPSPAPAAGGNLASFPSGLPSGLDPTTIPVVDNAETAFAHSHFGTVSTPRDYDFAAMASFQIEDEALAWFDCETLNE